MQNPISGPESRLNFPQASFQFIFIDELPLSLYNLHNRLQLFFAINTKFIIPVSIFTNNCLFLPESSSFIAITDKHFPAVAKFNFKPVSLQGNFNDNN